MCGSRRSRRRSCAIMEAEEEDHLTSWAKAGFVLPTPSERNPRGSDFQNGSGSLKKPKNSFRFTEGLIFFRLIFMIKLPSIHILHVLTVIESVRTTSMYYHLCGKYKDSKERITHLEDNSIVRYSARRLSILQIFISEGAHIKPLHA